MQFEFDPAKSQIDQSKHGINFEKAKALWNDASRVEIQAISTNEPRFMVIGIIDGKHWSAIVTYRNFVVRIISVRRSREGEVKLYGS
ncbi:MAG: BrnT family toxin [Pseudanabaena sp. CAN_BIN31]|nr:BrnT family toxin [Pseudanabaena sp. CAN_BIN31]